MSQGKKIKRNSLPGMLTDQVICYFGWCLAQQTRPLFFIVPALFKKGSKAIFLVKNFFYF
jgi:hypothetical protein